MNASPQKSGIGKIDLVESCPKTCRLVLESYSLRSNRTLKIDPGVCVLILCCLGRHGSKSRYHVLSRSKGKTRGRRGISTIRSHKAEASVSPGRVLVHESLRSLALLDSLAQDVEDVLRGQDLHLLEPAADNPCYTTKRSAGHKITRDHSPMVAGVHGSSTKTSASDTKRRVPRPHFSKVTGSATRARPGPHRAWCPPSGPPCSWSCRRPGGPLAPAKIIVDILTPKKESGGKFL